MKKLTLALVAALSLSTAAFAVTSAGDGQIKFTGTVTAAGCTVVPGDGVNSTIHLGSVPAATLQGKTSPWVNGEIKFEGCKAGEGVDTIKLTVAPGTAAKDLPETWANETTSESGVGIKVEIAGKNDYITVSPTGTLNPIEAAIHNDTAIYKVRGQMVGANEVKPGPVSVTLKFTAEYE